MPRDGSPRLRESLALEPEILVGCRGRHVRDEPEPRLLDAGPVPAETGQLEDRGEHDLVVHELLDPVEDQKGSRCEAAPRPAREAYSLYVERAGLGANCRASEGSARPSDGLTSDDHADGPFSAACWLGAARRSLGRL